MPEAPAHNSRPNFFIVGAPKCGTTAWVEYLRTHPDIFLPDIKEPHFFAGDLPGKRWTDSPGKYESLFANAGSAKAVGEASVFYLYSTEAAEAIHRYDPDAKIIIFLRPQEQLLPSLHHQFLFTLSEDIEDFERAWSLSGKRPPETIPDRCPAAKLLDYKAMGRLREQVERFLDRFPPRQVRVVRFQEWTSDPRSTYLRLLDFLGVEDDGRTDFPPVNEAKSHLSKSLTRLIHYPPKIVRLPVEMLRKLTGRHALGIANRVSTLLARRGYRTSVPGSLLEEIRSYYEKDNQALDERLESL